MGKKVILLNGPPSSGKDTIVQALEDAIHSFQHLKFAEPLKVQCAALLGITVAELELCKDRPMLALKGDTSRQYIINMSEKFIKPVYGKDFFGHVAADKIRNSDHTLFIFSDSGFLEEALPVGDEIGIQNMLRIELHRKGCDYSNDSRSYWSHPYMQWSPVYNDTSIENVVFRVHNLIRAFIR